MREVARVELRETPSLVRFAGFVLNFDAWVLARDSGETIPLTRGEFTLLRTFVGRPGRVLSRDTLLGAFANRRFESFDRSVDVLIGKLRRKIEHDPKRPRLIVTVPGQGYRFDGLTQSFLATQRVPAADPTSQESPDGRHESESPTAARPAALGATAGAEMPASREPPRLSIVVLPFTNIGGDPEQDHFVDGVTESLTTDLSRIRGALVIARNTAFTYKSRAGDVRAIGRDLSVRYVLEGSLQRSADRMRVNVQLLDAESGGHLWAERFDKPIAGLFDMQDEIVACLANALNTKLASAEAGRAKKAMPPDSMDLYFQGLAWLNRGLTPDNVARARGFFDRALSADPNNIDALVGSARVDSAAGAMFVVADPMAAFFAAETKVTKALSTVPDHARGHMTLGLVYILTKRAVRGIAECEHALALDRNLAPAHAFIGLGKILIGRAGETEAHIVEAFRLSPRDTMDYSWMNIAGMARNHVGQYDQAVSWFQRAIEANRNYPHTYFVLGIALALLGRLEEARASVRAGLAINPSLTVSRARDTWTAMSDDPTHLGQLERFLGGLRMAGVPEQ